MESTILGDSTTIISGADASDFGNEAIAAQKNPVIKETQTGSYTAEGHGGILDDEEISRLYTPIEVAKEEIWKRWNDKELRAKVEEFLGGDIPEVHQSDPKIVLGRHIISPNREALHFLKVAEQIKLNPLFGEYLSDKFVPENKDKYYLANLFFYDGVGKHGGERITTSKIIDIKNSDGNIVRNINTLWGEGLVDFHHRMFREMISNEVSFFDISSWFARHGGKAKDYYLPYLALFLCHGVLAEVFLTHNRKERAFVESILIPAFDKLESLFGVRPLIIPLFHSDNADTMDSAGESWMQYHESLKELIPDEFVS